MENEAVIEHVSTQKAFYTSVWLLEKANITP